MAPPSQSRPKPKSAAEAWAIYKAQHPDKKEEEEEGADANAGMKGAIDISGGSDDRSSSSPTEDTQEEAGQDGYVKKMMDQASPYVEHAKEFHAKAKDSWEGLETGVDFGFVLAFCLFLLFLVLYCCTRCCCRTRGVTYSALPQQEADLDAVSSETHSCLPSSPAPMHSLGQHTSSLFCSYLYLSTFTRRIMTWKLEMLTPSSLHEFSKWEVYLLSVRN